MRIALVIAAVLAAADPAPAQPPEIAPFRPALTKDTDPALCGPFLVAWTRVFDGTAPLNRQPPDLRPFYPEAEVVTLPADGAYLSTDPDSFAFPVDLDGGGVDEVLHFETTGSPAYALHIYVFDGLSAYSRATLAHATRWRNSRALFFGFAHGPAWTGPRPALNLGPLSRVQLISRGGAVHTLPALPYLRRPRPGEPVAATLYRLQAIGAPVPACVVELLPGVEVFNGFTRASAMFGALKTMYGAARSGCGGSRGWPAAEPETHLSDMFFRPQAMESIRRRYAGRHGRGNNAARELRLMTWGLADPNSWDVYLRLKASRAGFLRDMAAYYRRHFADSEAEADWLAELAHRFLIDRIVYDDNPDMFHLTRAAHRARPPLPLTPDSPPAAIAVAALRALLDEAEAGFEKPIPHDRDTIWGEAALAAIFTRQGQELVRALMHRYDAAHAALLDEAQGYPQAVARRTAQREAFFGTALTAALGDAALTALMLNLGADVNARTNWFGKTPLMYAAQRDDLAAARLLVKHGADPSLATDGAGPHATRFGKSSCQPPLQRDRRTALMYAAENAAPEMIGLLLAAGADARATDTRGHSALWYLDRSTRLTGSERAQVREWLRGPD